jgi:hypothetical protein
MNYTPTTLGVQSWREIISGVREQKRLNTTGLNDHSEGSQSRQTVNYGHESRGTRNQGSLCWRGPAEIYQSVWQPSLWRDPIRIMRQKNKAMGPAGPGTKNDCVDEGLHKCTRKTAKIWSSPAGLGTKNDGAGEDQQQFTQPTEPSPLEIGVGG